MERDLGAGADHQAVVGVEPADDDVRLDGGVLLARRAVLALHDEVGLLEALLDVAQLAVDVAGEVARGVLDARRVGLVVDHRRAPVHRVLHVEHGRQHLVLHLDAPQRLLGDGPRVGRDGGHAVADVPDLGVEQVGVVGRRLGKRLAGRGVRDARHVLVGQHRVHAGQRLGAAGVDPRDARMGMRARQDLADQHARQLDVVGEGGLAGDELVAVHLPDAPADDALLAHRRAPFFDAARLAARGLAGAERAARASAAASTASTGFL